MHVTPRGFIILPGTERRTAAAVVADVVPREAAAGQGAWICKRLGSRALAEPWMRARLVAEGHLLRSLEGRGVRGVARLVAAGEDQAGPWLVMERAPGGAIADHASRPVASGWLARVSAAAFSALEELHGAGVVHGDLSPDNVWASEGSGGEVRVTLLDLGLAVWTEAPPVPAGAFRGTLAYLAPEVARGEVAGPASDLFALAAALLHIGSGRAPVRPGGQGEAAQLVSAGEVGLGDWARAAAADLRRAGEPGGVADLLTACCALDAADRPARAGDVAAEMHSICRVLASKR